MKVEPVATNHIIIEMENGGRLDINDSGVNGIYITVPQNERSDKLIVDFSDPSRITINTSNPQHPRHHYRPD